MQPVMKIDIFRGENLVTILNRMKDKSSTSSYFKRGFRLLSIDKYNFIKDGFQAEEKIVNKLQK